jgi:hypothetical protein
MIRKYDTVEEQREGLELVASNIEEWWRTLAENNAFGKMDLSIPAKSDAGTLRLIASKLGEQHGRS